MRSAGPGRCLIALIGFIQCCKVTNSVVPFPLFQGFFVGATSLVLQQQSTIIILFKTFYIRSLAVARFD
jgi:hypothetical protein